MHFVYTYILALWWVLLGLANGVRAFLAFSLSPALKPYTLSIPLPMLGGLYTLWSGIFLILGLSFWSKRPWILQRWAWPTTLAYQATIWAIHIFGDRSDYARALWPWNLIGTGLFVSAVYILARERKTHGRGK